MNKVSTRHLAAKKAWVTRKGGSVRHKAALKAWITRRLNGNAEPQTGSVKTIRIVQVVGRVRKQSRLEKVLIKKINRDAKFLAELKRIRPDWFTA